MHTLGLDLAGAPEGNQPASRAPRGTLAERVFAGMFPHWDLMALGCLHLAVPRGTPVIAGDSLSAVVGTISGAAVRDRCPNGTGWPAGASR
jgi:hypothetical protein